jgi:hypothetical protein
MHYSINWLSYDLTKPSSNRVCRLSSLELCIVPYVAGHVMRLYTRLKSNGNCS